MIEFVFFSDLSRRARSSHRVRAGNLSLDPRQRISQRRRALQPAERRLPQADGDRRRQKPRKFLDVWRHSRTHLRLRLALLFWCRKSPTWRWVRRRRRRSWGGPNRRCVSNKLSEPSWKTNWKVRSRIWTRFIYVNTKVLPIYVI